MNRTRTLAVLAVAGLALAACSPASDTATEASASASGASCDKATLETKTPGKLVIATGQPAYEPWVKDDAPESGEGFEAAVAYAAAKKLGYDPADVQWARTTFDVAIAPGAKDFDWNIQQFSITEDREKAVDFSSSYYDVNQAIVSYKGSPIADAKTLADLESAKLGARSRLDVAGRRPGAGHRRGGRGVQRQRRRRQRAEEQADRRPGRRPAHGLLPGRPPRSTTASSSASCPPPRAPRPTSSGSCCPTTAR